MKLNIKVTQKNIDDSQCQQKCSCPIALAIKDELVANHEGGSLRMVDASVDANGGRFMLAKRSDQSFAFDLPEVATQFIEERDANRPVGPFSFSVTAKPYNPKSQLTIMREHFGMIP